METTIGLAFIAGLVSFISPCVLPLVPAYIGYMGGRLTHTVSAQIEVAESKGPFSSRFSTFLHGMAFVAGFTLVFVLLGLLITSVVTGIFRDILGRVGGVIIIFFGLHFMGVIPSLFAQLRKNTQQVKLDDGAIRYEGGILSNVLTTIVVAIVGGIIILWGFGEVVIALPVLAVFLLALFIGGAFTTPAAFWLKVISTVENALYTDTRRDMTAEGKEGLWGSMLMGIVFSAGWTPCIGPIYGSVLTLAANTGDVGQAAPLLIAYSLGLGIPFLLMALLLDGAQGVVRRLQRHMRKIELVSGAILIVIGITVATGGLQTLSTRFAGDFLDLATRTEDCIVGYFTGDVYFDQVGPCLGGTLTPLDKGEPGISSFDGPDWQLEFSFTAQTGDKIDVQLSRVAETVMPILSLLDPDRNEIANTEIAEPVPVDGQILPISGFTIPADGIYIVTVVNALPYVEDSRNSFQIKVQESIDE